MGNTSEIHNKKRVLRDIHFRVCWMYFQWLVVHATASPLVISVNNNNHWDNVNMNNQMVSDFPHSMSCPPLNYCAV